MNSQLSQDLFWRKMRPVSVAPKVWPMTSGWKLLEHILWLNLRKLSHWEKCFEWKTSREVMLVEICRCTTPEYSTRMLIPGATGITYAVVLDYFSDLFQPWSAVIHHDQRKSLLNSWQLFLKGEIPMSCVLFILSHKEVTWKMTKMNSKEKVLANNKAEFWKSLSHLLFPGMPSTGHAVF